jgi:uncharacterized protein with predicted RNA binding PUA domain
MSDAEDTGLEKDEAGLRTVADYQFGGDAGHVLFPEGNRFTVKRSSSGRPQQVLVDAGRLVSLNVDGRFTLGIEGGRRLTALDEPRNRVVVGDDKNVFAKFVTRVDEELRPGDEALVVHENGDLLAVGRAELSADAMHDFETGMAVKVREGADGDGT